ncbi:hypothetical protein BMS3Abin15_00479 [bacterium BMS3Abin15]|nr:hypothetical protein BMS3Abin15_00479 [bacterium BMS3Abin15]
MDIKLNTEYSGLSLRAEIVLIAIVVLISLFIFKQLKKKRLDEKYTILWILIAIAMIVLPVVSPLIDKIAFFIGFHYPPMLIFVVVILFFLISTLHNSMELTKLNRQNHVFAQELAIQENEIKKLKKINADSQLSCSHRNP